MRELYANGIRLLEAGILLHALDKAGAEHFMDLKDGFRRLIGQFWVDYLQDIAYTNVQTQFYL